MLLLWQTAAFLLIHYLSSLSRPSDALSGIAKCSNYVNSIKPKTGSTELCLCAVYCRATAG